MTGAAADATNQSCNEAKIWAQRSRSFFSSKGMVSISAAQYRMQRFAQSYFERIPGEQSSGEYP